MSTLSQVRTTVESFFTKELDHEREALRFLNLERREQSWRARVEVTEASAYLRKLGYPPIFDRNVYRVEIDGQGSVVGYALETGDEED